jgi:lysophospholipase L1-like esterase
VQAFADPKVAFVPISTAAQPWQSGTGNVGAATGSGLNDLNLSSDGVHPSDAGYSRFERRLADGYDAALTAMIASGALI